MALILNSSQARAAYAAMCELNNVSGRMDAIFPGAHGGTISLSERATGRVIIRASHKPIGEVYRSQDEFRTAYGIE